MELDNNVYKAQGHLIMRNTIELIIRILFYISYCIWFALYASYLHNNMHDIFALAGMICVLSMGIIEAFFTKHLPVSINEWENYAFWTALIIATIFNIIHWDEIVASQPQFLRVYLGNIFAR